MSIRTIAINRVSDGTGAPCAAAATRPITPLEKVALRLRVLSRDGMRPEAAAWIDRTLEIADEGVAAAAAPKVQDYAGYLAVAPGVQLYRFAGNGEVRLVARRLGSSGNPNTIFEIDVERDTRTAVVMRDNRVLVKIEGESVNHTMVEDMAISSLKRWFKNQRKRNSRRRRKARAKAEAMELATGGAAE